MGAEYRNMNGKANFILIAKEMDGKNLRAVRLFNVKTKQIQRVVHSKFMYMAQNNSIINCKASSGVLLGLQCSLRDIPAYDQTGRKISGLSEQDIINYVDNIINARQYKIIKKYRYKDTIVGYMLQDDTGANQKASRDSMYKLYQKGRLSRVGYKVTLSNGDVIVSGGDIQKVPVVDIDSRGNEIDKEAEKEKEQLEKEAKAEEKKKNTEERKIKQKEQEDKEIEEKLEKKTNKLSNWIIIELIKSKWFNTVKKCTIRNIISNEEKDISDKPETIDKIKIAENAKKLVIEQDDIDRAIKKFCGVHHADADMQTSIREFVNVQEAQAYSTYSQYEDHLMKVYEKVKLKQDYRISQIVLAWNGNNSIEISQLGLTRGNKTSMVDMEMFKQLVNLNIMRDIDINDVLNSAYTNADTSYIIRLSTKDLSKSVRDILNKSSVTNQIGKKYLSDIEKILVDAFKDQDTVGIKTLYKVIDNETSNILKKSVTETKNRLHNCIAIADIGRIVNALDNVVPHEAEIRSIYAGVKAVHVYKTQINNNIFISGGSFDNQYIEYYYNNDLSGLDNEERIKIAYIIAYIIKYYSSKQIKIRYQIGDLRTQNGQLKTVVIDGSSLSLTETEEFTVKSAYLNTPNEIYDMAMQTFGTEFISYIVSDKTFEYPKANSNIEFVKLEYGLDLDTEEKNAIENKKKLEELKTDYLFFSSRIVSPEAVAKVISDILYNISRDGKINTYNYINGCLGDNEKAKVYIGYSSVGVTRFRLNQTRDYTVITYGSKNSVIDGHFLVINNSYEYFNTIAKYVEIPNLVKDVVNSIKDIRALSFLAVSFILYSCVAGYDVIECNDNINDTRHKYTVGIDMHKIGISFLSKDNAKQMQLNDNVDEEMVNQYRSLDWKKEKQKYAIMH